MDITELILASQRYLDEFDYDHYPGNFDSFLSQISGVISELNEDSYGSYITELIGNLERRILALPRLKQNKARNRIKKVLALFFVPSCIKIGVNGEKFADELIIQWNKKNPREQFIRGEYETILKGFDSNILGIHLRKPSGGRI